MMTRKCKRKASKYQITAAAAAGQRICNKMPQKITIKTQSNNLNEANQNAQQMHMHNQFHTPPFFCARCFAMFVRFVCDMSVCVVSLLFGAFLFVLGTCKSHAYKAKGRAILRQIEKQRPARVCLRVGNRTCSRANVYNRYTVYILHFSDPVPMDVNVLRR